jgi:hypothetical protein
MNLTLKIQKLKNESLSCNLVHPQNINLLMIGTPISSRRKYYKVNLNKMKLNIWYDTKHTRNI